MFRIYDRIPPPDFPGEPIVVSDNLFVLPFQYYAPPSIASRVEYALDFEAILRSRGEASAEVNLWTGGSRVYGMSILPLATVQSSTPTYQIVGSDHNWLVDDLRDHHFDVNRLPIRFQAADLEESTSPLAHSEPVIFRSTGELSPEFTDPIPFDLRGNLPKVK